MTVGIHIDRRVPDGGEDWLETLGLEFGMLFEKTKRYLFEADGTGAALSTLGYTFINGLLMSCKKFEKEKGGHKWGRSVRFFSGRVCEVEASGVDGEDIEVSSPSKSSIVAFTARRLPLKERSTWQGENAG